MTTNVETGILWSAFPLDDASIARVEEKFSALLGKKVKLNLQIEPNIIGGIIVAIGDKVYDGSLRGQLSRMREHLLGLKKGDIADIRINLKSSDSLIDMESVADLIQNSIQYYDQDFNVENIGYVVRSGDGVVLISGLYDCKHGELLRFEGNVFGIAFNLENDTVGAVLLNNQYSVVEGTTVYSTGRVVQVPVGEGLLGRVVNPLGQPLDGKGNVRAVAYKEIEQKAPGIYERDVVNQPLQTGLLAIDSMIPIGRGQRQLIIGDRQTGKTAIALDTIVNQKDKDVICVYVAIGQKASTVSHVNIYNYNYSPLSHKKYFAMQ